MTLQKITAKQDGTLNVPNNPTIVFIEGDGIGADITPIMQNVVDAAVKLSYNGDKKINWLEAYAGEKAYQKSGKINDDNSWLPSETLDLCKEYMVSIKGPLTTPVGGGIRSLNVALRQKLDLYICLRPVRYFNGIASPLKNPEKTSMVIFRENSEDIYAGIEWQANSDDAKKIINYLQTEMGVTNIRFPENCGIGVKPVSKEGTQRLVTASIEYAIQNNLPSVTLVHKGNIMKFTEGAFKEWGYEVADKQFGATLIDKGPWREIINPNTKQKIIIKDVIADAFLQQILLRPEEYSVVATLNLNGDYISDALAAQVGGIGIAPGANIGTNVAMFEATHGTAPKYTGLNKVNPSSLILSAEMMLRHMGWNEAADLIISSLEKTIQNKTLTYDLARLLPDSKELSCSDFGQAIVDNMS